jgi:hypothetical protein
VIGLDLLNVSMSEIINVFIGKAGVRIGEKFVNLMAQ